MKIQQLQYFDKAWKINMHAEDFDRMQCQLVVVFGEPSLITGTAVFNYLERSYPEAHIVISSTSREVIHNDVLDNSVVVTAIQFDNTIIRCAETRASTEEQLSAVNEIFGTATCTTGFYSYEELSPLIRAAIANCIIKR